MKVSFRNKLLIIAILLPFLPKVFSSMVNVPVEAFSGNGTGTSAFPYIITTCSQLQQISNEPNAYYALGGNVECSGSSSWNSNTGFIPIKNFSGTLDGRNYQIQHLYINDVGDSRSYYGLFANIEGGTVENVSLTNASISVTSAAMGTGGIAGLAENSATIEGVSFSGNINGIVTGGIVAILQTNSILSDSSSHGTFVDTGGWAGGLAAMIVDCNLSDDYTDASITGNNTVGGIAGYWATSSDNTLNMNRVYSNAVVSSSNYKSSYIAIIHNATGGSSTFAFNNDLSASAPVNAQSQNRLTNFYSTNQGATAINFSNSYFDASKANGGNDTGCYQGAGIISGCNNVNSTTLYNSSSLNPFNNWNFSTIWQVNSSGLPILRLQTINFPTSNQTDVNLLANGGGETANVDGWSLANSGDNGFANSGYSHTGSRSFISSFNWDTMTQNVDLVNTRGYTTAFLDSQPAIYANSWILGSAPNYSDLYEVIVTLQDNSHNTITSWDTGILTADTTWKSVSHVFTNYGTGLRYINYQIRGHDAEYWSGFYGAVFDDNTLLFTSHSLATVTYNVTGSGSITDPSTQIVPVGYAATTVYAVSGPYSYFYNWSDTLINVERTDAVINGNETITANFHNYNPPSAPTNLTTDYVFGKSISVSWDPPSSNGGTNVTDYLVNYRVHGTSNWSQVDVGNSMPTTAIEGLSTTTPYDIEVIAVNGVGDSDPSVILHVTTNNMIQATLSVPSNLGSYILNQPLASGNGISINLDYEGGYSTIPRFNITSGSLPSGISYDTSADILTGTPTQAGTYTFTVHAEDDLYYADEQFTITIADLTLFQSSDISVTPTTPGTISDGFNALATDGNYAVTALSQIDGGYDSQVYRYKPDMTGYTNPKFTVSWTGHGDVTSTKLIHVSIWNNDTNSWNEIGSKSCPSDCTLSSILEGTKYLDSNGYAWIWVKAEKSYNPTVITNVDTNSDLLPITWNTDQAATTQMVYDTVPHPDGSWSDYAYLSEEDDTNPLVMDHSFTPDNPAISNGTWYFRVLSRNVNGDLTVSDEYTINYFSMSSCPFVFTYDGSKYNFIIDASSAGDLGTGLSRTQWALTPFYKQASTYPNPQSYAKIPTGDLTSVSNGSSSYYDVKTTTELDEVNYYDAAALVVIDHDPSLDVYPDYRNNGEVHSVSKDVAAPVSITDQSGNDISNLVGSNDNVYYHSSQTSTNPYITIKLVNGDTTPANLKLVIKATKEGTVGTSTGKKSTGSDQLLIENSSGQFVTVPASYNPFVVTRDGATSSSTNYMNSYGVDTRVIDLSGLQITNNTIKISMSTSPMQWDIDWIAVDTTVDSTSMNVVTEAPYYANLYQRGVSKQVLTNPNDSNMQVTQPVFAQLAKSIGDSNPLSGYATRDGNVIPLLASVDNQFVVMVQGDALDLKYQVPTLVDNTQRDFIYYSWDYHKTFTHALGDTIAPLPFNTMSQYPYDTSKENYPFSANQSYINTYNTRLIDWADDKNTETPQNSHSLDTDSIAMNVTQIISPIISTPTPTPTPSTTLPKPTVTPTHQADTSSLNSTPTPTPTLTPTPLPTEELSSGLEGNVTSINGESPNGSSEYTISNGTISFQGTGTPGDIIEITMHSTPIIKDTVVSSRGSWSLTFNNVEGGQHQATVIEKDVNDTTRTLNIANYTLNINNVKSKQTNSWELWIVIALLLVITGYLVIKKSTKKKIADK